MLFSVIPHKWLHISLVLLVLTLSYVSVLHAVDSDPHHHQQHQCNLYQVSNNALIPSELTLDIPIPSTFIFDTEPFISAPYQPVTQHARAPPALT
ncbi:DUF2607 family protein [Vibrio sp. Of7-15]|uniref:DUF2607 family protein n=1 Tax=Vibrio sp. Of7-15 TaxID=2724879 RepID=UPI001EF1C8CE|nr:DUF2607 family protein [Vibrio sp. Of7-15]MCG7498716.1 DUF2607 family protein [Vibrio sp. Of7-15]